MNEKSRDHEMWFHTCQAMGVGAAAWYVDDLKQSVPEDMAACKKDFAAGVPRAQQYMVKYLELRMKG